MVQKSTDIYKILVVANSWYQFIGAIRDIARRMAAFSSIFCILQISILASGNLVSELKPNSLDSFKWTIP